MLSAKWALGVLLGIVLFTALLPTIFSSFTTAAANTTGAAATVLGLGGLIVVIIFFVKLTKKI